MREGLQGMLAMWATPSLMGSIRIEPWIVMTICHNNNNYYLSYRIFPMSMLALDLLLHWSVSRRHARLLARLPACITCVLHASHSIRSHCFIPCGFCVHTKISIVDSAHKTKTPCTLNYFGTDFSLHICCSHWIWMRSVALQRQNVEWVRNL